MATTTTRLALRKPDPTELVNVATDLDANFEAIDAAVGIAVTTALPTNPYAGKAVAISTDGYRSYFSNGTAPASASWVELLNSSGMFGSDIKVAAGKKLIIGTDVNLYRSAANVLATDDSLSVAGSLTVAGAFTGASNLNTGPWTSYTPTWTASTTNPTLGNGTLVGQYVLIGKTCIASVTLTFGSTTTLGSGNYVFGMPFTAANNGVGYSGLARFNAASIWLGQVSLSPNSNLTNATFPTNSTTTTASHMSATGPVAPAAGNSLTMTIAYQIA